jgi:hypothetical protein
MCAADEGVFQEETNVMNVAEWKWRVMEGH